MRHRSMPTPRPDYPIPVRACPTQPGPAPTGRRVPVVTTAIAIYAALVSTVALALGLVSEWRSWGTRVEVKVEPGMAVVRPHLPDEPAVVFRLINHSAHPVKITH